MAQVLLVIGFAFAVAFFVMSSTKKSSPSRKRSQKKRGRGGEIDLADIGDLTEALSKATEAMERMHTEQNIEKLSAKYGGASSSGAAPAQVKVKLDRIY